MTTIAVYGDKTKTLLDATYGNSIKIFLDKYGLSTICTYMENVTIIDECLSTGEHYSFGIWNTVEGHQGR